MKYITISEFRKHFDNLITRQTVWNKIKLGKLKADKTSSAYLIPKAQLDKWRIVQRGQKTCLETK